MWSVSRFGSVCPTHSVDTFDNSANSPAKLLAVVRCCTLALVVLDLGQHTGSDGVPITQFMSANTGVVIDIRQSKQVICFGTKEGDFYRLGHRRFPVLTRAIRPALPIL